jgi:ABC-type antimicrobial peptide transport system permease subunit
MEHVGIVVDAPSHFQVGLGLSNVTPQQLTDGVDPAVLALSAVALALVALCAGFIPADRASRVDPMRALKYE